MRVIKVDLYIAQFIALGKQLLASTCIPSLDSGREYLSSFMRLTIYRNNLNTLTIGWAQLINVLKLKVNRVDYTGCVEQTCGVLVLGNIVVIVRCDGVVSHPVMDWELIHHLHPSKVNLYNRLSCRKLITDNNPSIPRLHIVPMWILTNRNLLYKFKRVLTEDHCCTVVVVTCK